VNLDLAKILNECQTGAVATFKYLSEYGQDLIALTFRPSKFAGRLHFKSGNGKRASSGYLFLLTTLSFVALINGLAHIIIDSDYALSDVGLAVILQSGAIWDMSWEALVQRTVPLTLALMGISWLLSRACGHSAGERKWLREIFPYVLWRSAILLAVGAVLSVPPLLIIGSIALIPWQGSSGFFLLLLFAKYILFVSGLLGFSLSIWRLKEFIGGLRRERRTTDRRKRVRLFIFRIGAVVSLLLPIWWSMESLSSDAAKVAIQPDPELIIRNQKIEATINLRNLSNNALFAKKHGSILSWWDDEHPVFKRDFFSEERVPNGSVYVDLDSKKELKDGIEPYSYTGDLSQASLTTRSYSPYDFMGGPEIEPPTEIELNATRGSLERILNKWQKGHIDVSFVVVTKGGKTSRRTVTLLDNSSRSKY